MSSSTSETDFGQNEWLVEEMYQQYQKDPNSVDPSWHDLLKNYTPNGGDTGASGSSNGTGARAASANGAAGNGSASAPAQPSPTKPSPTKPSTAKPSPATSTDSQPAPQRKQGVTLDQGPEPRATSTRKTPAREASATKAASGRSVASRDGSSQSQKDRPAKEPVAKPAASAPAATEDETKVLRGPAAAIAKNMAASLQIPTATSVRAVPAKLMIDNRIVINNHLARTRGGKISFTHILGYAIVQAIKSFPNMNRHFAEVDGKPNVVTPAHTNLGLAIDLVGKDGNRTLVVAAIKKCETMGFAEFYTGYQDIVRRARDGKLGAEDFAGVTVSLTNPGTIGTVHSVPRLMKGQGAIIGAGAMEYPAEFQGASDEQIAELGVGKLMTLTSTYDHRIIQGAESGDFLRRIHELLLDDAFYDEIFTAFHIPYEPIRWRRDIPAGAVDKNTRVLELIAAYRNRGHLMADIDPLMMDSDARTSHPDLDILTYGLTLWDLDRTFNVGGFHGQQKMKLRDVLSILRDAYCRHVGVEYTHILEPDQQRWLQERVEIKHVKPPVAEQKYILSKLNAAEAFETFLQTKYVGQKRFSLEGAESVIPMMDAVIDQSAEHGLGEVVIGMPHRGRLNVLANIVGKPYSKIFTEFEGNLNPSQAHGSGDVKYHLGAEGKYYQMFGDNEINVSLTANPSHLEAVDPVLEGLVRAKQDQLDEDQQFSILPLMLHGDAAFAGQGVVPETLNLAMLPGYRTGGTVHIVVNNQVGFTTAPEHSRSSEYCTDVAKMIGAPIFHVNGDDPEACVWAAKLAVDYRETYHKDVVIDLVCFRRRGHNEGDDPSMTQPAMYDVIDTKRGVRKSYTEALIGRGDISTKEAEDALRDYQGQLERVFNEVKELEKFRPEPSESVEADQPLPQKLVTAVDKSVLAEIGDAFFNVPEGFDPHPRVKPVLKRRHEMSTEGGIDWAFAELLAFGSLVIEGRTVRLSGQDSRRGTFTQRHSVLIDRENGSEYTPLNHLTPRDGESLGRFMVYDSPLSEFAVVGFEYGYSVGNPDALVLWEAQFGDFVNGAQSIIDEFISSGEAKWGQRSDVVLLLPHGHEGQGPDHTSGRIERFLQLCAEGSMTVALPSTPASYFHLLRRHVLDGISRPLIVFTPKSMLRNKAAVSPVEDFTEDKFRSVIDDPHFAAKGSDADRDKVKRVLLVSGKLYYELAARREKDERDDIAIVRVEQLYPVPHRRLRDTLERYPNAEDFAWVQEEPANQGPWPFLGLWLPELLPDLLKGLRRLSRRPMSAPSSGSSKVHAVEQAEIIDGAFA
ncbi:multifunctional oxoglutarate decarboxylase/oxoglutarate dehydrogenase thiamine pyrophosphate-binding subunit/dihydrolipoyllysine-residue succinyltransferase subunit [Gordonia polyisoprenivorans]|uniref:Multifunctional oxoglutarate decarboxylase/oxoglutarate dehydrogenase thiamine pyrophosphate-binding subunit/dihydrolipoyllysine-residue succinyltransferase subunit n=2 Tax=Gordonia polyisoprenivorans TaxID=84595 RepID=A0A846WV87_9ACTN|nr:multifunctional oxoglutarate decarboxylase/oxoglutarate dehydrogenase thiamine pyrophosphate-binding subunit/dihydrolipoyllysine-residue succinyltransferase subunit [Gordonia polyisoprenivorans]NKY04650.1 multifunctional oxoglutarate decarboxylase/oxoglutarate dehydrogenase thiamine pyrophosphate-binding subunit/dihydrolipoyllysine-residue succinyltransferase subunit [Gordonia polyisoprenivorans]OZC29923.1 2-oxoglutarate dehydrogenase E1 component [Gordonia polyisoprenivorans]UZF58251.1 multi